MGVLTDAILGGIAYEAFSKTLGFYTEQINNFALRQYIALQLKDYEVSDKDIDFIEATIVDTPDSIKEIKNNIEQKEEFKKYFKINVKYGVGVVETGATVNQNFTFNRS